jgi:hypothetical protein
MRYIIPSTDPRDVETEAELRAFLAECDRCERENTQRLAQNQQLDRDWLTIAIKLHGENSAQARYCKNAPIPQPPKLNTLRNKARKAYEEAQQRVAAKQQRQRYKARQDEAIEALEAAGYAWGVDFGTSHAISKARDWLVDWEHGDYARREGAPLPLGYEMKLEVVP